MRKESVHRGFFSLLLTLFLVAGLPATAQGVRELGMGGVLLPGLQSVDKNPAFAAIGDPYRYTTWTLPLGALGLFLPDRSPLYYFTDPDVFFSSFDLLSFYDQAIHPNTLLLNPARSPDEVVITIDAEGVRITDGNGNPISIPSVATASSTSPAPSLTPRPFLQIPFRLGDAFTSSLGLFVGAEDLSLRPNPALAGLIAGAPVQANETYELTATGGAQAGLTLDFSFATPVPSPPDAQIFVGARGAAFLGLAKVDGETTYRVITDDEAKPSTYENASRIFYSYLGDGYGYGARIDLGLAVVNEVGTFGIGVQNLVGFAQWSGTEVVTESGSSTSTPKTETFAGFQPAFYVSGAGYVDAEDLGRVLVAADLGYDGTFYGHAGAELPLGPTRLRAGLGYQNGLQIGAGFGLELANFKLDLALTGQRSSWDGHMVFGLTAGVGF